MLNIFDSISHWEKLIENAEEKFIYGDELDTEFFRLCMSEAYNWFFEDEEINSFFDKAEEQLYTAICTYSKIEPFCLGEYTPQFRATTEAAKDFAKAIKNPEAFTIADRKMIQEYYEDGEIKQKIYDFKTGDLQI